NAHNAKLEIELAPLRKQLAELLKRKEKDPVGNLRQQKIAEAVKLLESKKRAFKEIRAFYDLPGEVKTPLLKRGEYTQPGPEVTPGVLRVLTNHKAFEVPA